MKKIILGILVIVVIVGGFFWWRQNSSENKRDEVSKYFYDRMIELAIADIGMAIEGFDPNLLILAYPGLKPRDFQGVQSREGKYQVRGEEINFVRTESQPISSAERTISEEGYQTLLNNLTTRLSVSKDTKEDIDNLIEKINTAERVETKLGQGGEKFGFTITPTEVLEDSRCPIDVQCIQAGTVRVRASIVSPTGQGSKIFELDKEVIVDRWEITLIQVDPVPESSIERKNEDYIFYFRISTVTN